MGGVVVHRSRRFPSGHQILAVAAWLVLGYLEHWSFHGLRELPFRPATLPSPVVRQDSLVGPFVSLIEHNRHL